jgi:hypothetical protein
MEMGMDVETIEPYAPTPLSPHCDLPGPVGSAGRPPHRRAVTGLVWDKRAALLFTLLSLATGLLYLFLFDPIVNHRQQWDLGGDVWGIWRAAQYVSWGDLGGVYTRGTGVVSLPGMAVLLAPFALLGDRLGLSQTAGSFVVSHPTAALVLQPVEILFSSTVIFAADAVARHLGVGRARRTALCGLVALLAWPVGVVWGHAEDTLALAIAMYALLACLDRKWARCGWLFGVAVAIQPLVALLLPLLVGASPAGQRIRTVVRATLIPAFLLVVAAAGDASDTFRAVVEQPTPPQVNRATPWVALAPVVHGHHVDGSGTALVKGVGEFVFHTTHLSATHQVEVSGGPGRLVYLALAVVVGFYVWRHPQEPVQLLWLAAAVLSARCMFEAVMTPYYLAPPLILTLVVAAHAGRWRFWSAGIVALATSVFAYFRFSPWMWWLPVVAGSVVVLVLAFPTMSLDDPALHADDGIGADLVGSVFVGHPASS